MISNSRDIKELGHKLRYKVSKSTNKNVKVKVLCQQKYKHE